MLDADHDGHERCTSSSKDNRYEYDEDRTQCSAGIVQQSYQIITSICSTNHVGSYCSSSCINVFHSADLVGVCYSATHVTDVCLTDQCIQRCPANRDGDSCAATCVRCRSINHKRHHYPGISSCRHNWWIHDNVNASRHYAFSTGRYFHNLNGYVVLPHVANQVLGEELTLIVSNCNECIYGSRFAVIYAVFS